MTIKHTAQYLAYVALNVTVNDNNYWDFTLSLNIRNPSQFLLAKVHPSSRCSPKINTQSKVQMEVALFPV